MARTKRRMTAVEFDAVRPLLPNIREDRSAAARAALVDGETLAAVAQRYGWTRQAVNGLVNTFWEGLTRYHEAQRIGDNADVVLPPGYSKATFVAPDRLIAKWRAELASEATADAATPGAGKSRA